VGDDEKKSKPRARFCASYWRWQEEEKPTTSLSFLADPIRTPLRAFAEVGYHQYIVGIVGNSMVEVNSRSRILRLAFSLKKYRVNKGELLDMGRLIVLHCKKRVHVT
jgi:hypothetical protein